MASKNDSAYTKVRNQINRYLNSQKKKGYIPTEDFHIPTERERRATLTERARHDYAKYAKPDTEFYKEPEQLNAMIEKAVDRNMKPYVRSLQNALKELKSTAEYVSTETGEILTAQEIKNLRHSEKLLVKENEKRFWSGEEQIPEETLNTAQARTANYTPDGGEIIFSNVVNETLAKLSQSTESTVPNMYGRGKHRRSTSVVSTINKGKSTLINLIQKAVAEKGESAVGWALDEYEDLEAELDTIAYGYNEDTVNSAVNRIAEAINGAPLSMEQRAELADESEANEWWETPD